MSITGKILAAGGISGTTSLNTAELYSPSAGTWIAAGTMDAVRHGHTATLLPDGRVLAAGGLNGSTTLQSASLYNPASGSGSWVATTGPIPPPGLRNHTATLIETTNNQLNNHVLLVGGNNGTSTIAAVYLFDPVQNAFSTLASISSPREQHMPSTLQNTNGKILIAGGLNGSAVQSSAIVFDPGFSNGSWSSAGTMTSARVGATMTLLPNTIVDQGQVLVAGGSSTGSGTLSSAELFSNTSTWTATASMPGPMKSQAAVLLSGNMVLVAGGLNGSTVLTSAFLYDASFGLSCTSDSQCASGFCTKRRLHSSAGGPFGGVQGRAERRLRHRRRRKVRRAPATSSTRATSECRKTPAPTTKKLPGKTMMLSSRVFSIAWPLRGASTNRRSHSEFFDGPQQDDGRELREARSGSACAAEARARGSRRRADGVVRWRPPEHRQSFP